MNRSIRLPILRPFSGFFLSLSFLSIFLLPGAAQPAPGKDPAPLNESQAQLEGQNVVAYTKSFAKRFALPEPTPGFELEEGKGIQAMEFVIEKGPAKWPTYSCNLKVYVDDDLPIAYPEEGRAGSYEMAEAGNHFFGDGHERFLQWSESDRRHSLHETIKYTMKAHILASGFLPGKGFAKSCRYEEHYRTMVPELSYLMINAGCFQWPKKETKFELWFEKRGGKNYNQQLKLDPGDFLKFKIPERFYSQLKSIADRVKPINTRLLQTLRNKKAK